MPKQKTRKAAKKRFRVTATGKVLHRRSGTSHLATHKTKKRRRKLRRPGVLEPQEAVRVKLALAGNGR